jgi:hypothetical protein
MVAPGARPEANAEEHDAEEPRRETLEVKAHEAEAHEAETLEPETLGAETLEPETLEAETLEAETLEAEELGGDEPEPEASHAGGAHDTCPVAWCPLCLAVSMTQPLHPEAMDHLLKAGTELLLAVRAVVNTRAAEVSDQDGSVDPTRLQKIDLG